MINEFFPTTSKSKILQLKQTQCKPLWQHQQYQFKKQKMGNIKIIVITSRDCRMCKLDLCFFLLGGLTPRTKFEIAMLFKESQSSNIETR